MFYTQYVEFICWSVSIRLSSEVFVILEISQYNYSIVVFQRQYTFIESYNLINLRLCHIMCIYYLIIYYASQYSLHVPVKLGFVLWIVAYRFTFVYAVT